jgi:hypothetical protein
VPRLYREPRPRALIWITPTGAADFRLRHALLVALSRHRAHEHQTDAAALDGIYGLRTSVPAERSDTADTVRPRAVLEPTPTRYGGQIRHVQGRLGTAPLPRAGGCVLRMEGDRGRHTPGGLLRPVWQQAALQQIEVARAGLWMAADDSLVVIGAPERRRSRARRHPVRPPWSTMANAR